MTIVNKQVAITRQLIAEHQETVRFLQDEMSLLLSQLTIPCGKCNDVHAIKDLAYVQVIYYEDTSGCTDGDYYYDSDENEFICPSCGTHNMLRFECKWHLPYAERSKWENSPEKQFKREFKHLFDHAVRIKDTDRRQWGSFAYSWVLNDYVEKHMDLFGIGIEYSDQNMASK